MSLCQFLFRCALVGSSLLTIFFHPSFPQEARPGSFPLAPDKEIQAQIRRAIPAVVGQGEKDNNAALSQLKEVARQKPETLVPQVIYFKINAANEGEGWGALFLMTDLSSQDSEMRRGLIPLLEAVDAVVRRESAEWLAAVDGGGRQRPRAATDLRQNYRELLLRKKDQPAPGLVQYVYDLSASEALVLFGEIYLEHPVLIDTGTRPLMWSDHVITTLLWRLENRFLQEGDLEAAKKEVDALSKHEGWYVRRYVVHILLRAPQFGTPEIVKRLKADTHPLVKEAADAIHQRPGP